MVEELANENIVELDRQIEAILMVSMEPVLLKQLSRVLNVSEGKALEAVERIKSSLSNRGYCLVNVAGGYRFESHPDFVDLVREFAFEERPQKLSAASLETLAIIAYRQPISRAQISAIRGVNADSVVRQLLEKGFVEPIGRDEGPGQAVLLGTTSLFLEKLKLASISELPPLIDFVPDAEEIEILEKILRPSVDF